METKHRILTIGGATQDIFIMHNPESMAKDTICFEAGKKYCVSNLHYAPGGGAVNVAYSFKKLGFDVQAFFKYGTDYTGNFLKQKLTDDAINITRAVQDDTDKTGRSFILPGSHGNAAILGYPGIKKDLKKSELPLSALQETTCVYITSLANKAIEYLPDITQAAKKYNNLVACNPGKEQLEKPTALRSSLQSIDILIVNKKEAEKLFKHMSSENFTIKRYMSRLANLGPQTLVVTDGKNGVYVWNNSKEYFQESFDTHVVSTVGAGDSFGSCFVASILAGYTIEQAMHNGVINSASVLQHLDAQTGLLSFSQIKQRHNKQ